MNTLDLFYWSFQAIPHSVVLADCGTHHHHTFESSLLLSFCGEICDLYWGIKWSMKKTENYISSSWERTQQQNSKEMSQSLNSGSRLNCISLFFCLWCGSDFSIFTLHLANDFESFSPFSFHFYNPFYLMMGKEMKLLVQFSWIFRLDVFLYIVVNVFTTPMKTF